jgi:hypothetical protein
MISIAIIQQAEEVEHVEAGQAEALADRSRSEEAPDDAETDDGRDRHGAPASRG